MKVWRVTASSMFATYSAGVYTADTREDAIEQARDHYRQSRAGRAMNDVGAFTWTARPARLAEEA